MGQILRNWRVPAATLFSAALIFCMYMLARGVEAPPTAEASAETALLAAIATKDSTGDGLPDWQKVLYGIPLDAMTTDYFHLGMTDGEAVAKGLVVPKAIADVPVATSSPLQMTGQYGLPAPSAEGTLTDVFAKSFLTLYVAAKQNNGGMDLSPADTQTVANEVLNSISGSLIAAPDFKSASDIKVSIGGSGALRSFAVDAEAVLKKNATDATMSDLQYLDAYVQNNDATALVHLGTLAKAYRNSAAGLSQLSTPKELAAVDLAIVNSIMRLGEIYNDFSRIDTDPLAAMFALQQYPQTELNAEHAFTTLANIYTAAGVTLTHGTPGASFVNVMANIGKPQ